MKNFNDGSKKISWGFNFKCCFPALIAALTALGSKLVRKCPYSNVKFS